MPELSEITYSTDATVAAFRDYYQFLTNLYLNESDVIEPPEGGWPTISPTVLEGLGKDDEVIELLRYLPYIRTVVDKGPDIAPWAKMMDWQDACGSLACSGRSAEDHKFFSEGEYQEHFTSSVVGITFTGPFVECFLLDTEQGTIYWPECHDKIRNSPTVLGIVDDPSDYCESEEEAQWRSGGCWAVVDFFETLKDQYKQLHFLPLNTENVIANNGQERSGEEGLQTMLQDIYRQHGWPDLGLYRKEACLKAVQKALVENYPARADYTLLDENEQEELDARSKANLKNRQLELFGTSADE